MKEISIKLTDSISIGENEPLLIMSGPCVIEDEQLCKTIAKSLKDECAKFGLSYVFKASFDKANRTSIDSFRGPGIEKGLEILNTIKTEFSVPVLTDVHSIDQIESVAKIVDIIQIPAFLCRQTDLLIAAGESGLSVNIKKGQFMAPHDMQTAVEKVRSTGNNNILLTERGTTFGYNNLVVDMRSLVIMRSLGVPVIFDATHSVQLPGGQGKCSGGQREFIPHLIRAATAIGIDGLFIETHPNPDQAKSDGPNSIPLSEISFSLNQAAKIHELFR